MALLSVSHAAPQAAPQGAAGRPKAPFRVQFIGEGSPPLSISPIDHDYYEHSARQAAERAARERISESPARPAVPDAFTRPDPRISNPAPAPAPRETKPEETSGESQAPEPPAQTAPKRYSLWDGLVEPLDLPADQVAQASPDSASRLASKDYDSHILGRRSQGSHALIVAGPTDQPVASEIFVSVELNLIRRGPGDLPSSDALRDAVADLERAASFRRDPRFEPSLHGAAASIWGWMPAQKIAQALQLPSVSRLELSRRGQAKVESEARTELLLGVRVAEKSVASQAVERVSRELALKTGLRWQKTVGAQPIPGSKDWAVLGLADVPVSRLAQVLGHPEVIRAAPRVSAELAVPTRARADFSLSSFLSFVRRRSPMLIALTALLALAPLAGALSRRLAAR